MPFHKDTFVSDLFEPRTMAVPVAALVEYFDEGEKPEFTVRGLSASEIQRGNDASHRQASVENIVKAIANQKEQVDAIRSALGLSDDVPGEIAKRLEHLVSGCVEPKLDSLAAAKLAEAFPIEFYDLTNKIMALSGQGGMRVKQKPSSRKAVTA